MPFIQSKIITKQKKYYYDNNDAIIKIDNIFDYLIDKNFYLSIYYDDA